MPKMFFSILILFISSNVFSQNAIAFNYLKHYEGPKSSPNNVSLEYQWINKRFAFGLGAGLLYDKIAYSLYKKEFDYSHGPPGYSTGTRILTDYSAQVKYKYLNLNFDFSWKVAQIKKSSFWIGLLVQPTKLIGEKETNHFREIDSRTTYEYNFEYTNYPEITETTSTRFNALSFSKISTVLRLNLKHRLNFNSFYGQYNFGAVYNVRTRLIDAQADYIQDESYFESPRKISFSFGASIGYYLGSKKSN